MARSYDLVRREEMSKPEAGSSRSRLKAAPAHRERRAGRWRGATAYASRGLRLRTSREVTALSS
jgi:hypothetical protein